MDAYIVYTVDADNKKTIWKKLYRTWDAATQDIQKAMETKYSVYLMNFISSENMTPKVNKVTPLDAETRAEGVFYAHMMNGSYRYHILKLDTSA